MEKRLIWFVVAPAFSIIGLLLLSRFDIICFDKLGQSGDFFNGIFSPFIGVLVAFITYNAWQAQIKANELQRIALERSEINSILILMIQKLNEYVQSQQVVREKDILPLQGIQAIIYIESERERIVKYIESNVKKGIYDKNDLWNNFHSVWKLDHFVSTIGVDSGLDDTKAKELSDIILENPAKAIAITIVSYSKYTFLQNIRIEFIRVFKLLEDKETLLIDAMKYEGVNFFPSLYKQLGLFTFPELRSLLVMELDKLEPKDREEAEKVYKKIGIME